MTPPDSVARPLTETDGGERNANPLAPGWAWARLSEVAQVIAGQSPPSETYNDQRYGLPFFQGKSEFGSLSPTPRKWCATPSKVAEAGDVLISVRAPVGPTNIATERCGIGRGLAAIRASEATSAGWLLHYLRFVEPRIADKGIGTTFAAITTPVLSAELVPIAPLAEQRRIVARIDELFAEIAEGEAALDRARKGLDAWRRALLKAAATGELTRDWRETHHPTETAAALLARSRASNQRRPPRRALRSAELLTRIDALPMLPGTWAWERVSEIGAVTGGLTKNPNRQEYRERLPFSSG